MSYTEKVVSAAATTDINTFKTMLLNGLAETSDRITVENDSIVIDEKYTLGFTASGNNAFNVSVTYDETSLFTDKSLIVASSQTTKTVGLIVAENDSVLDIKFQGYGVEKPLFNFDLLFLTADNKDMFAYGQNNTAASAPYAVDMTVFDSESGVQMYNAVTRLPYTLGTDGKTKEIITSKVFVSGSQKVFEISNDMTDCSNLSGNNSYPVGNETYYALSNNTLIPV